MDFYDTIKAGVNGKRVTTGLVRIAFANFAKPKVNKKSGKTEWGCTLLIPKGRGLLKPYHDAAVEALAEKWPSKDKWPRALRSLDLTKHLSPGRDGWPLRDGDIMEYEGFEGMAFIGAKSYEEIPVVDSMRNPIEGEALRKVVSGLICRLVISAAAFDVDGNQGVSFWCNAVQVCKDDDVRFGGRVNAKTAFEDFDDGMDDPANYDQEASGF